VATYKEIFDSKDQQLDSFSNEHDRGFFDSYVDQWRRG
jgi:hypothetical protein